MCRAVTEIELSLFPGVGGVPGAILSGPVKVAAAVQRLGCWAGERVGVLRIAGIGGAAASYRGQSAEAMPLRVGTWWY